jgi:hypothetical protein
MASIQISEQNIKSKIYLIRSRKVMLDLDLAKLYDVTTFNLNKAVRRNIQRFPDDFMFQLTKEESQPLRFQIGMSKISGRGGRRTFPLAFTQEGVAMLSSVLRSEKAIQVNITIMRVFTELRTLLDNHKDLSKRLDSLESAYENRFKVIFDAIHKLMSEQSNPRKRIIGLGKNDD